LNHENAEENFLHDLASPLAAALLVAETVISSKQPLSEDKLRKSASLIHRELEHLRQLLETRRRTIRSKKIQDPSS
jgi:signal transduction histidine kinase